MRATFRSSTHRVFHLVKRIDDEHGIGAGVGRQLRIVVRRRAPASTLRQPFALHAALDRLDHQTLHVDRVDPAVRRRRAARAAS